MFTDKLTLKIAEEVKKILDEEDFPSKSSGEKTCTVKHKTSGKELTVVAKKQVLDKYKGMGYKVVHEEVKNRDPSQIGAIGTEQGDGQTMTTKRQAAMQKIKIKEDQDYRGSAESDDQRGLSYSDRAAKLKKKKMPGAPAPKPAPSYSQRAAALKKKGVSGEPKPKVGQKK